MAEHDSTDGTAEAAAQTRRRSRTDRQRVSRARAGSREGRQPLARPDSRPGRHRVFRRCRHDGFRPPLRPPPGRAAPRARASSTSRGTTAAHAKSATSAHADGGGRVTERARPPAAAPLLPRARLAPAAARRRDGRAPVLVQAVPFTTGYGLEIGLLIDIYRRVGAHAISQVDLHTRQNRHRPLEELGPMSDAILESVTVRLAEEGRLTWSGGGAERASAACPNARRSLSEQRLGRGARTPAGFPLCGFDHPYGGRSRLLALRRGALSA